MTKVLFVVSLLFLNASMASAAENGNLLEDLAKMTFSCPAAALNAAARAAALVPTNGHYQFVSFNSDGSDRVYSVSFESNYHDEPRLNYEVTLYCQQGWDPNSNVRVVLKK